MNDNSYNTLSEALSDLKKRGYTEDFNLKGDCIHCPSLQLELRPEEFEVDEVHRFEGMSYPGDNSVVYAISSRDRNIKGVLTDAYGAYAEAITPEMARKLRS